MSPTRIKHIVRILPAPLIILAAGQTYKLRDIRHSEQRLGHTYSAEIPPMLSFTTVALGGFRGLVADMLWLRATGMQEQGRFIELAQLAEWITALEPANGEVWAFHAWNLAYNVSLMTPRPEDRWRWVRQGINLLRNEGVRFSPANSRIRRELAWMFQHKLGSDADRHANLYRTEWARETAPYLEEDGAPPQAGSLNFAEIREALGLEPDRMSEIDRRFGGLDWRVPGSHAVYWALEALEKADESDRLACRRIAYQSLAMMILKDGALEGDPDSPDFAFSASPNERLLEGALSFMEETLAEHSFQGVRVALASLLLEGSLIDVRNDRPPEARAKYERVSLMFKNPDTMPDFEDFASGRAMVDWSLFPDE